MRTLYDIQYDHVLFDQLDELLDRTGGEITPEIEALMTDLEGKAKDDLDNETKTKVANYCRMILDHKATAKARREEAARLERSANVAESKASWLEARLLQFLQAIGESNFDAGIFRISRQGAGGKAPLELTGEVPAEYQITKTVSSVDNAKIRAEIDAGKDISFARLGERKQLLKIR